MATTENVCGPTARPEYPCGLEHAVKAPPSSMHAKVLPASVEANENEADVLGPSARPALIVVSGGVVSAAGTV